MTNQYWLENGIEIYGTAFQLDTRVPDSRSETREDDDACFLCGVCVPTIIPTDSVR